MRLSGRKASSHAPRWTPRQRVVLLSLIGVNFAVFVAQQILQAYQPAVVVEYLGLSYRGIDRAYAWQFFSAMFLHAGVFSFAGSMIVLYFIGRDVESILGQKHFLYLYLVGLVGGEVGHLFLMPATTVLFAAPGGVAAVVVAFATILPELELTQSLFFIPAAKLKAKYLGSALFAIGLLLVVFDRQGVVSHSAFLGGGCRRVALRASPRLRPAFVCAARTATATNRGRTAPADVAGRIHRRGNRSCPGKNFAQRLWEPDPARAAGARGSARKND